MGSELVVLEGDVKDSLLTYENFSSIEKHYSENREESNAIPVKQETLIGKIERGNKFGIVGWATITASGAIPTAFAAGAQLVYGTLGYGNVFSSGIALAQSATFSIMAGTVGVLIFVVSEIIVSGVIGKSWTGLLDTRILRRKRSRRIMERAELEYSIALQEYNRKEEAAKKKIQEIETKSKSIVESYNKSNERKIRFVNGIFEFDTKKLSRLEEIALLSQQKSIESNQNLALGQ